MKFKLSESEIRHALLTRLSTHPNPIDDEQINIWFADTFKDSMADMSKIATTIAARSRDAHTHISWYTLNFNPDTLVYLWALRECILARSLLEACRNIDFPIYANILGSTTLLSDIDVTIESNHSSHVIEFIEDLWFELKWFNHSSWRVDLYGDFTMIGDFYMNIYKLNATTKQKLLELAVASYLRHQDSHLFDKNILNHLIRLAIKDIDTNSDVILTAAKTIITEIDSLDSETYRHRYYELLNKAETLHNSIVHNETLIETVSSILLYLAHANLYREENYILPSTVVHIVKIEQNLITDEYDISCGNLLTKIAKCSLDEFAYILSAIEQLGYMQANLYDNMCTLAAGKYFGRFLRAIQASHISINSRAYKIALEFADTLADKKRERGEKGNVDILCEGDLYNIVQGIFSNGGKPRRVTSKACNRSRTKHIRKRTIKKRSKNHFH